MAKVETVKVKSDAHPSGYITVNKTDAHKYEEKPVEKTRSTAKKTRSE